MSVPPAPRTRRRRPVPLAPATTEGVIPLPPPATASNTSLEAIATTHDRVRAILGSHLWKLGFVTEQIEVPPEAGPRPGASWEVRIVAHRRALRQPRGRRRRDRSTRLHLSVRCHVRRRLFGRVLVKYELPTDPGVARPLGGKPGETEARCIGAGQRPYAKRS